VGAACIRNPRLIMVDEASLGLAPLVVDRIFEFLEKVAHEGKALLIVDQFATRALALADTAYVLSRGSVTYSGSAKELGQAELLSQYLGPGGVWGVALRPPACDRADRIAAAAACAEAAGFDSVWIPDSQLLWRDTFVALALAAASTSRITLAPGVTNLVTRHVTVVASAARTVQELAPGRFTLALGAGRSAADMAGATHTPTRELGESLRALRAGLSGQPWSFA